ncbi:hypothetical protein ES705_34312 [subsurface metagenome]
MMEKIPISKELISRKMNIEGVPPDEQALYIPFAVASEIEEELRSLANEYVNDFVYGRITEPVLTSHLDRLASLDGQSITEYDVEWIVMSPAERKMIIERGRLRKERREAGDGDGDGKHMTGLQLSGATEYLPLPTSKLASTLTREGYPADEKKIIINQTVAKEISEEVGRLTTELITDFASNVINETKLKDGLADLATLGGAVPDLMGLEWLILSPIERDLLVSLAKLKKARKSV